MAIPMVVVEGQLASQCFMTEQQRANAFAAALQVTFPATATVLNYGSATPAVDQQDFPWYRINSDGTPDKLYTFYNGFWTALNPVVASAPVAYFFEGNLASLATYDGGEGSYTVNADGTITPTIPVGIMTGPMWQVDTNLQGRFPLGVSNTSVASQIKDAYGNIINNWAQGSQGGEIQHTLTTVELAPHTHSAPTIIQDNTGVPGTDNSRRTVNQTVGTTGVTGGDVIASVSNTPIGFNVLNPYYAGYWIKRTARALYRL